MKKLVVLFKMVFVVSMLLSLNSLAFAKGGDHLWDEDGVAVSAVEYNQGQAEITTDGYGGAIIVFEDNRHQGADYNLYAQRIDATGSARWTTDGVPISTASFGQDEPQIASDGNGGAIIVWEDYSVSPPKIYAQRINGDGEVKWDTNGIVLRDSLEKQENVQILTYENNLGETNAVVVWQEGSTPHDIYAQKLDMDGDLLWTTDGVVICDDVRDQQNPQLAYTGNNSVMFTWKDRRGGVDYDIYAVRLNSDSSLYSGWAADGNAIYEGWYGQVDPQIATMGGSSAIITWEDGRNGNRDIYAQKVDGGGTIQWDADGLAVCTADNDQIDHRTAAFETVDNETGIVAVWQDKRNGSTYDIYAQGISSDGDILGDANGFVISDTAGTNKSDPYIIHDGSGGAVMTWYDSDDAWAQRINAEGYTQWGSNGIQLPDEGGSQDYPRLVSDDSHGAIIVYNHTYSWADIYVQRTEGTRTWYFAEGTTYNNEFDTYILIQNPENDDAICEVTFMKEDGTTVVETLNVAATSRETIHTNGITQLENSSFSTQVKSINGIGVIAERAMYWDANGVEWTGGHDSIGITQPHTTWYFAEGTTRIDYSNETYILIQNPYDTDAECTVTFMKEDGTNVPINITVEATSRETIYANDYSDLDNSSFSTKVESTNGVLLVAERAMYWGSDRSLRIDGHCSKGSNEGSLTWYLAEGAVGSPGGTSIYYEEYVLIQNPGHIATQCAVMFMRSDGTTWSEFPWIADRSRYTIPVNLVADETTLNNDLVFQDESVSVQVVSMGEPLIVERAMYWHNGGIDRIGGHCSVGVTSSADEWVLPEGSTSGFDTWVLIQNPNYLSSDVQVTFMLSDGSTEVSYLTIPGTSRYTIYVNDVVPGQAVSTKVETTNSMPVISERAMYWDAGGIEWAGGHCSVAVKY